MLMGERTNSVEVRALSPEELPAWVPVGWTVEVRVRKNGISAGAKDRYYTNPVIRRKFRSKEEIIRYFASGNAKKQRAGKCLTTKVSPHYTNPMTSHKLGSKEETICFLASGNTEKQLAGECTSEKVSPHYTNHVISHKLGSKEEIIHFLASGKTEKQLAGECTSEKVSTHYANPMISHKLGSKEEIIRFLASGNTEKQLTSECTSEKVSPHYTSPMISHEFRSKEEIIQIFSPGNTEKQLSDDYRIESVSPISHYTSPMISHKFCSNEEIIHFFAPGNTEKQLAGECATEKVSPVTHYTNPIIRHKFCSNEEIIRFFASGNAEKQRAGKSKKGKVSPVVLKKEGLPEWLPMGWIVEVRTRMSGSNAGQQYKTYVNPSTGHKFYSKNQVCFYLQTGEVKSRTCRQKKRSRNELASDDPPSLDQEHRFVTSRARRSIFGSHNFHRGKMTPEMKGFTATHVTNSGLSIGYIIGGDTTQVDSSTFQSAIQEKPFNNQMVKFIDNLTQNEKPLIGQKEKKVGSQNQKHVEDGFSEELVTRKPFHCNIQKTEDKESLEKLITRGSLEQPIKHLPVTVTHSNIQPINGVKKCKLEIQEKFPPDPMVPCVLIGQQLENVLSHSSEKHMLSDHDLLKIQHKGFQENGISPGFVIEKSAKDPIVVEPDGCKRPKTADEKHKTECPKVPTRKNKHDKASMLPCRTSKRLAGLEPELVTRFADPEQALRKSFLRRTNQEAITASRCNESSTSSGNVAIFKVNADCKIVTEESVNKKQSSPLAFTFGDSWSDPCLEFAYKTLTDVISVDSILPTGLLFQKESAIKPELVGGKQKERKQG